MDRLTQTLAPLHVEGGRWHVRGSALATTLPQSPAVSALRYSLLCVGLMDRLTQTLAQLHAEGKKWYVRGSALVTTTQSPAVSALRYTPLFVELMDRLTQTLVQLYVLWKWRVKGNALAQHKLNIVFSHNFLKLK